jgi:hypothetical protein
MKGKLIRLVMASMLTSLSFSQAYAALTTVRGKILVTQGHTVPACRMVQFKRNDNGAILWFRIAATGVEDGILAITITALTTGKDVEITYDPALTTGCGTEPAINFIALISSP